MKIGQRLRSQVCGGEVIVIRADGITADLETGGQPLVDAASGGSPQPTVQADAGFLIGKRYELGNDSGTRLEVMVTRAGGGPLIYGGQPLTTSQAKTLPASD
ncbi:hypothetical protein FEZ60_24705 [Rhodococcus sp. MS16]|uniref:hypothetical protein n=1 Tax=Rhodococcus globerulus TaxID=33008 RepID=UPI001561B56D|nr:hypothetical protein [Rhodococcus globerulus]MCE4267540.1 hypothetical protein [Rhodococcus globerulus]NRI68724.1 hypothetical protein [Rhodococcus sp. MS16]